MIRTLAYTSLVESSEDVDKLIKVSIEANVRKGVGSLLYVNPHLRFVFHVMEGEKRAIYKLMRTIYCDSRHHYVRIRYVLRLCCRGMRYVGFVYMLEKYACIEQMMRAAVLMSRTQLHHHPMGCADIIMEAGDDNVWDPNKKTHHCVCTALMRKLRSLFCKSRRLMLHQGGYESSAFVSSAAHIAPTTTTTKTTSLAADPPFLNPHSELVVSPEHVDSSACREWCH